MTTTRKSRNLPKSQPKNVNSMNGEKKLIPIEEIRAMRERGLITPNGEVADLVDKSFSVQIFIEASK